MKVIKRGGQEVNFDLTKIVNAIYNANMSVDNQKYRLSEKQIMSIVDSVVSSCEEFGRAVHVEEIQDMVEESIMQKGAYKVAKNYITYRYRHELLRKNDTFGLENIQNNSTLSNVQIKESILFDSLNAITKRCILDADLLNEMNEYNLYFHGYQYLPLHMISRSAVKLSALLEGKQIKSFPDACAEAAKLLVDINNNQYRTIYVSFADFLPYVELSKKKLVKDVGLDDIKQFNKSFQVIIKSGIKILSISHNVKFVINYSELIKDSEKETISLMESLAKDTLEIIKVKEHIEFGTFVQGEVTLNLVNIALKSNNINEFFNRLIDKLDVCHQALGVYHDRLRGVFASSNPTLFIDGGVANLKPTDKINKLLKPDKSFLLLNLFGLKESSMRFFDKVDNGFIDQVLSIVKVKIDKWNKYENVFYKFKDSNELDAFLKPKLQQAFGIIKGVTA